MNAQLLVATIVLVTLPAPAAVTVLGYYRLGDADPGAIPGNIGNDTTIDSAGTTHLTRNGSPTYSSSVPYTSVGGASNSLSLSFPGTPTNDYTFSTRLTDAQDNFGLEAFVNTGSTAGNATIVYNGKPGTTGFGFLRRGDLYQAQLGTNSNPPTIFGSAPATTGVWVHLALVRDNGLSTFYVDGVASGTSTATPLFGSPLFRIGGDFGGLIDEVRLFTFAPGAFTTNDLLVKQVPEARTTGLIFLGMITFFAANRRGRSLAVSPR